MSAQGWDEIHSAVFLAMAAGFGDATAIAIIIIDALDIVWWPRTSARQAFEPLGKGSAQRAIQFSFMWIAPKERLCIAQSLN